MNINMKPIFGILISTTIIIASLYAYSQETSTEIELRSILNNPKLLKRLEDEREFVLVAAAGGDLVRLRAMLDSGVNINAMDIEFGWTALTVAADNGRLETIKFW